jgi:hypothetical protein
MREPQLVERVTELAPRFFYVCELLMLVSSFGVVKIINMNLYRKIHALRLHYTMKALFLGIVVMSTSSCLSNVGGRDCERCAQFQSPKSNTMHVGNPKPVVNVYMENSGSMFGYVDGLTEFEASVYSYLSDIANTSTDSLNLFYINSRIIPQQSNELSNSKKNKGFYFKIITFAFCSSRWKSRNHGYFRYDI